MSEIVYILKRESASAKLYSKGFSVIIRRTLSGGAISEFTASALGSGSPKKIDPDTGAPIGDFEYVVSSDGTNEPKIGDRFISDTRDEVIVDVTPEKPSETIILWNVVTRKG